MFYSDLFFLDLVVHNIHFVDYTTIKLISSIHICRNKETTSKPPRPQVKFTRRFELNPKGNVTYLAFLEDVSRRISVGDSKVEGVGLLGEQKDFPEFYDLEIDVRAEMAVIRYRNDNIYFIGFQNRRGEWFEFSSCSFIPGSRQIYYDGSYDSMRADLHNNKTKHDVLIGPNELRKALIGLLSYSDNKEEKQKIGKWLMLITIMTSEALRFKQFRKLVDRVMEEGTSEKVGHHADDFVMWEKYSKALRPGTDYPQSEIDIAKSKLWLVLNKKESGGIEKKREETVV